MKIKRYYAQDMRSAILKVREELGPDAVILSNTHINGGMEIVAAVDYDESLVHQFVPPSAPDLTPKEDREHVLDDIRFSRNIPGKVASPRQTSGKNSNENESLPPTTPPENIWSQEPTLLNMQSELKTLRSLLVDQLSGLAWNEASRQHPLRTRMLKRMIALGINPGMARKLVERVDENSDIEHNWRLLLGDLAHRLTVTNDDILNEGGFVALVGPTGVGKTTTIAFSFLGIIFDLLSCHFYLATVIPQLKGNIYKCNKNQCRSSCQK